MFIRRRRPSDLQVSVKGAQKQRCRATLAKSEDCAASNLVQNRLVALGGGGFGGGLLLALLLLGRGRGIVREGNGNCAQCERQTKHQRHQLYHVFGISPV